MVVQGHPPRLVPFFFATVCAGAGFQPVPLFLSTKTKSPRSNRRPHSELFSVNSVLSAFSVLIPSFSLHPYLVTSLLPPSRNAPHPAPPKAHPGPRSSSSESLPRLRSNVLPATRAKLLGAPYPLLRVSRSTPAPLVQSRRKTSSTHPSSSSQFPAPATRR